MSGILYLVSTPIGNLGDMTARATEMIRNAHILASEDTRHTGLLLSHLNIQKQQVAYHDFNKVKTAPFLVERLKQGESVALVSDAGMPGIADPGYLLVRLSIEAGITVAPIPGASAVLCALAASGLPTDRFAFENFPPRKSGKRQTMLENLRGESRTLIFFESPFRVVRFLEDILTVFGDIPVVIARELTKKFEEILRKPVSGMIAHFTKTEPRGEFVVMFNLRMAEIGSENKAETEDLEDE